MKCVIRTFTGRQVNPLDLRPKDICIEDIAHALACCNRFAGHVKKPISVAQHSVYVSRISDSLQGLLHDASEAYLGDMTKWLKGTDAMAAYRDAEDRAQQTIYRAFGCPVQLSPRIEHADRVMVRFEGLQGFGNTFTIDHPNYPPLTKEEIVAVGAWGFWSWREAERGFLDHYRLLQGDSVELQNQSRRTRRPGTTARGLQTSFAALKQS